MERIDRPVEILLVEDNPGDIRLTKEALKEGKVKNHLHSVVNGAEALEFLYKKGKHKKAVTPDLVLLDLNLPILNGREVLNKVKNEKELLHIPFIVLTSSEAEQDILQSYQLHANCYITKPLDMDKFFTIIHGIENFWLTIVRLPGARNDG